MEDTGVKLLGGDFARTVDSLLTSVFCPNDSGNIPEQQTFSGT